MDAEGNAIPDKLQAMASLDPKNADHYVGCTKAIKPGTTACQKAYDFLECTMTQ